MASARDPRPKIIRSLDISKAQVKLDLHLVFLCGGKVELEDPRLSIRSMFMDVCGGSIGENGDVVLAEDFLDWHTVYDDLSQFENDIAAISSLVVIILESPGALTEFGLFYANRELRSKLLIAIDETNFDEKSFIRNGLLNPLMDDREEMVRSYSINHMNMDSVQESEIKGMVDDVVEHLSQTNHNKRFDYNDRGHVILLIFQLIDLFGALSVKEIQQLLDDVNVYCSLKKIKSALYILKIFKLIGSKRYSSQDFYVVRSGVQSRINLVFAADAHLDFFRAKILIKEFYEKTASQDTKVSRRLRAIKWVQENVL
ncbi:hypothetical protein PsAD46_00215 [Pseudovibrio sp. Ad46]|uniref:retron St85 family effector protein n=1 Tax=Pseudovibrio sp. Ad46 TaxID=989432 RepID=UPI0007AE6CB2|nr:retron St85 family effector protein [Pseudovibrio sp. Ad46]KZK95864.1 hypothetical protein PsAD46_00215 [Pseudovibrio sp. Ad46]